MKIRIIWIDKTRKGPEKEIIEDYGDRIRRFSEFEIIELKSSAKQSNPASAMEEEMREIERHIPRGAFLMTTSPEGRSFTSEGFASLMKKPLKELSQMLVIVVGGRYGIAESLLRKSDIVLSLSKMTLNHYLVRIFILEQLYRGFSILENHPYAK